MQNDRNVRLKILEMMRLKNKILASSELSHFITYINPRYQMEWFHRTIAEHCQKILTGEIKNLMVFVPPQHGKSEIVSRLFPAFALGYNPNLKIVGCSYSAELSCGFSRSIQRVMDTKEYIDIFPETYLNGSNVRTDVRGYLRNVDVFECVNHTGFYKAVGVGGGLTGTPVDIAIIDDPVKDAMEANSSTYRERVWDWYNSVLTTRLHNKSKQLFIMTRWHDDDLAGRILKAEPQEWTVLSIPAICEVENDGGISNRKVGEALWEDKHSLEKLLKQQARSPREFSSLYQQHPTVQGGNIIKNDWFKKVTVSDFNFFNSDVNAPVNFFIDTAYTDNTANDPTGIIATCLINNTIYITAAKKVNMKFPDLIRFLPEWVKQNGYTNRSRIAIEPKANGISVVHQLKENTNLNITFTPTPKDGKETRLYAVSPVVECGRVALVAGVWNEEFMDEVCGFPAKAHDEYVDVMCYAINYYNSASKSIDIDYNEADFELY